MTSFLSTFLGVSLIFMFLWDGYDAYKECPGHFNAFDKSIKAIKATLEEVVAFGFTIIGFLATLLFLFFLFTD